MLRAEASPEGVEWNSVKDWIRVGDAAVEGTEYTGILDFSPTSGRCQSREFRAASGRMNRYEVESLESSTKETVQREPSPARIPVLAFPKSSSVVLGQVG